MAVAEAGEAEADGDHAGVGEEGEGVVGVAEVLVGGGGGGGEGGGHGLGDIEEGVDVAAVDGFGHDGGGLVSSLDWILRENVEKIYLMDLVLIFAEI